MQATRNVLRKYGPQLGAAAVVPLSLVASVAHAAGTGPDFSGLTSSIDLSTVITAILAAAGILMGVAVTILGARKVIGFFSR